MAMRPKSTKLDLPSTHDVNIYIHNAFAAFFKQLKENLAVSQSNYLFSPSNRLPYQSNSIGRISATMDLWSVNQTKATFLGITAHWIDGTINSSNTSKWTLQTEVITFRGVVGAHTGDNLGHYFVGLCEQVGIISHGSSKVCCTVLWHHLVSTD